MVACFEGGDDLADALVLRMHVAQARQVAGLHLGTALRIAGVLQASRDARVDHEQLELSRERDLHVLQRAAVEQQRVLGAGEQRGRLVHDSARNADGPALGSPAELGQL